MIDGGVGAPTGGLPSISHQRSPSYHPGVAPAQKLYAMPRHPYTEALLSAVPTINPDRPSKRIILTGDVPNPANPPPGCVFHPRCPYAVERCRSEAPAWRPIGDEGHLVACHRADELQLVGTA